MTNLVSAADALRHQIDDSLMMSPWLSTGDLAPNWRLRDLDGMDVSLLHDALAGNVVVLVLLPSGSTAECESARALTRLGEATSHARMKSYAVLAATADKTEAVGLGLPVLIDAERDLWRSLGRSHTNAKALVLRPNHHVAGIFEHQEGFARAAELAMRLSVETGMRFLPDAHPPVLHVPDVFSRDECLELIRIFDSESVFLQERQAINHIGMDYKMRIPEHMREDRIDHFFFSERRVAFLSQRLQRVIPEIRRAFQYQITRYESLRMARYEGTRGGHGFGHRDNVAPHLHRRFAMSINLNTEEFEGGELRFPEFGDIRYRPPSGAAIVFSSSLLHEALHVTAGRRYVFLAFLFGQY